MTDYNRAARLAYKTLLALHIETLPVDPLQILSFCRNTTVHTYTEVMYLFGKTSRSAFKADCMEGKEAMTIRRDFGSRIGYELIYDNHVQPLRQRFTLAHELGHILMKHHDETPSEEREADYFASQLLAPHPIVEAMPDDADLIASTFHLSRTASRMTLLPPRHVRDEELYTMIRRQFAVDMPEAI